VGWLLNKIFGETAMIKEDCIFLDRTTHYGLGCTRFKRLLDDSDACRFCLEYEPKKKDAPEGGYE